MILYNKMLDGNREKKIENSHLLKPDPFNYQLIKTNSWYHNVLLWGVITTR